MNWKKIRKAKWFMPLVSVIAVIVIASGVFAYMFFSGSVSVTVKEPMTWQETQLNSGDQWDNSTGTWTVSMYAGETHTMTLTLTDASSADIPVTVTFPNSYSGITIQGGGNYTVTANSSLPIQFSIHASTSVAPEVLTIPLTIAR